MRQLLRSLPFALGTGCGAPDDSSNTSSWVEAAEGGSNIEGRRVVVDSSTLGSDLDVKSAGYGDD